MRSTDISPPKKLTLQTVAEYLCTRVPVASPVSRAAEIRHVLEGQSFESATEIAICDAGKLVGLISIEKLMAAPGEQQASELMDPDPPIVAPGLDQEKAAWKMVQHGESSLAVVDADGRFLGLVPPRRLLAVLLWEHEEDMARLGGFVRDAASARSASQETIILRFWPRFPWLLVGLLGALASAELVGSFESQLQHNLALAFFIAGIVYLADAVGTQTETLVIRGLSVGISIGQVIRREVITGLLVGLSLSLFFLPVGLWRWKEASLAFAVSLSLVAACATASLVAMSLPWIFHRLGRDPAFGSGPLATVIQDLFSILLYLGISISLVD